MKILFLTENMSVSAGGQYTAVFDLSNELIRSGHTVRVIDHYSLKHASILKTDLFKKFDIIHIFGIWSYFHLKSFLLCILSKKKIVISTLGMLDEWSVNQKYLKKKIAYYLYQKFFLQNCSAIHVTSIDEYNNLLKLGFKKVFIIEHGLPSIKLKKKFFGNIKLKKLLYFGRIHPKKGLLNLLEVLNNFRDLNWCLNICGIDENNYSDIVKKKIFELRLQKKVFFTKPVFTQFEKLNIFNASDIFILPSYSENFSISVLESLRSGVPVCTTDQTPWKNYIKYNFGWICTTEIQSLTNTLSIIFNCNKKELSRKSNNSIKLFQNFFRIEKIAKKHISLYNKILGK
jgi:glycosyltransferase involved in cell wall biosynthesis